MTKPHDQRKSGSHDGVNGHAVTMGDLPVGGYEPKGWNKDPITKFRESFKS